MPVTPTRTAAARTVAAGERIQAAYDDEADDPRRTEVAGHPDRAGRPDVLLGRASIDLGDRLVELVHPGRGHTGGDLVVRIDDADVVLAGDLVEESARRRAGFGADCYPMEWPATLDLVLSLSARAHAWSCRGTARRRPRLRAGAARRDRRGRRDDPRPRRPRRARATRRWRRPSGPTRARSSATPYAAATSTCRGPEALPLI